ncbi:hypothetical protein VNI00_008856 [Paramarasmius palmivorus]|uniref:Uncharacterized protein n=1 Tax=Paramarasmius palmivorus TaxID=297713 RepID=A0AAW0CT03_9AGAR
MRWLSVICIAVVSSWGLNVTIDSVDPTTAELEDGTIRLHITWRADGDGSFQFALKKPGVDDFPIASASAIDSKSPASDFKFESVSPGNYSLVAWNVDASNNGVTFATFSAVIEARNPTTSLSVSTTATSAAPQIPAAEGTPRSKPTRSLIIGVITGPICFTALVLIIGIYLFRKRRKSKNRTVSRPFNAQCVPKHPRKLESTEPAENTDDDNPTVTVAEAIRSPPRIRRHNDSGWRPGPPPSEVDSGSGSNVLDLPPEYEYAL